MEHSKRKRPSGCLCAPNHQCKALIGQPIGTSEVIRYVRTGELFNDRSRLASLPRKELIYSFPDIIFLIVQSQGVWIDPLYQIGRQRGHNGLYDWKEICNVSHSEQPIHSIS